MSKIAWAVVIGILILLILALGAAFLIPFGGRFLGMGFARPGMMGFGFPFFLTRGIGMFVFWLLIIGGAILIFQSFGRRPEMSNGTNTLSGNVPAIEAPLDILKRRYASGEITVEQFEEMKKTLGVA